MPRYSSVICAAETQHHTRVSWRRWGTASNTGWGGGDGCACAGQAAKSEMIVAQSEKNIFSRIGYSFVEERVYFTRPLRRGQV